MGKYALVIGINYTGTKLELKGCIEDANRISSMLKDKGFKVFLLTEFPVYNDIVRGIHWLASKCYNENILYFHFSGHGIQLPANIPGEPNRLDNYFIAYDGKYISNDFIHKHLVSKITDGVKLRGSIDCCNSKSHFDLKWCVAKSNNILTLQKSKVYRNSYCDAIIISGCCDGQSSYDTIINGNHTGVFTHYLLSILAPGITISELSTRLENDIRAAGFSQIPNICVGKHMALTSVFL